MIGLIKDIFGTKSVIDGGMSFIDKLHFSDQEKSNLRVKFLEAYKPFKKAQRLLSIIFSGVFLLIYLNAVLIWNIGVFYSSLEMQGFYMAVAFELAEWNTKTLSTPVALILSFYFGGGMVESFIARKG